MATVLAAIIGGLALVLVAMIPLLVSVRRHVKATAEQVTNDHSTNLRVELDQRNKQYTTGIAEVKSLIRSSDRRNGSRYAHVNRRIDGIIDRLELVEDTQPHPQRRRTR